LVTKLIKKEQISKKVIKQMQELTQIWNKDLSYPLLDLIYDDDGT